MGRGRVDHTAVKRLLNEKKQTLRDSQLFSSRIMAGYFEDIATAQTKRYNYNRRIRVKLVWKPKSEELAVTDNSVIAINSGNKMVTSKKGRLERFWIIFGFFAHELGHLLYSDFLVLQTYMNSLEKFKWYPIKPDLPDPGDKIRESELWDYVKADPKNLQALMLVAKNINNIIEDGYIENRILNNFPGSIGTALEEMRESFFEDIPTVSELIEEENAGERHIFESIMQVMLSYAKFGEIKYGSEPLTDERVQTVFALLDDIDKALLNKSAKERLIATNTILVRCWDYIKEFCEYVKERSNQMSFVYQLQVVALGKHLCGSSSSMASTSPSSDITSVFIGNTYLFSLDIIGTTSSLFFMYPVIYPGQFFDTINFPPLSRYFNT